MLGRLTKSASSGLAKDPVSIYKMEIKKDGGGYIRSTRIYTHAHPPTRTHMHLHTRPPTHIYTHMRIHTRTLTGKKNMYTPSVHPKSYYIPHVYTGN